MISATRVRAATAAVTVISNVEEVTHWSMRYLGQWWLTRPVDPATVGDLPTVVANLDQAAYEELTLLVHDGRHTTEVEYAGHRMLVARDGDDVIATSPDEGVAYRSSPARDRLVLAGTYGLTLALAAARMAREVIRGRLVHWGWVVLHASAVSQPRSGATILAFGGKGAGKTACALLLASAGWELLANDRVLVRPTGDANVEVLPWPAAAGVGLGLLDSLGWTDAARSYLKAGGHFHPTQDQAVTEALHAAEYTPLQAHGRELKVQVFPDQLTELFDVPLSTGGRVASLLFPQVDADAEPALIDGAERTVSLDDFMTGATEDRYPDVFELSRGAGTAGRQTARDGVAHRLATLPHHQVRLSHDIRASVAVLGKAVELI
ncbi:hypothetical protein ACFWVB_20275 [Streptomyces microflavus]|uniref:hypothetical protein n=1 Tax=Streptomyces microflavus TaxID=1919 RepID=UPI00365950A3